MHDHLLDGFALDGIIVEPLSGQYAGPTRAGHLGPRAIEVLLCLAKRPRELVTREELLERVWGDGHTSPESLTHAVSELRHAFDDHANDPTFIQTVPRRGYRLLVQPAPRAASAAPRTPAESTFWSTLLRHGVVQSSAAYLVVGWLLIQVADATFDTLGLPAWSATFVTFVVIGGFPLVLLLSWFLEISEGRMVRDHGQQAGGWLKGLEHNYLAIVAAYALAVFGAGIYQLTVGFAANAGPEAIAERGFLPVEENSIAVLKFQSLDGSERSRLFSDGLSEDVIDRLAKVGALSVSARVDAWSLPQDAPSATVRRRLRVAYFVEGSVRLHGNDLVVVAQLIDSETGRHIISRTFDRKLDDFLTVQRELTQLVVSNLRVALPDDDDLVPALGIDEAGIDTYLLYQQGRQALQEPPTSGTLETALAMFDKALERDPGFAVAHAGKCNANVALYELEQDARYLDAAERSCAAAHASSSRLPEVYTAIGRLRLASGDLAAAESAFDAALRLDSRDVGGLLGLAEVHQSRQEFELAEGMLEQAVEQQPGNWQLLNSLAALEFAQGRYVDAVTEFQHVVYLNPDNYVLMSNLGGAQILAGQFEDAEETIRASLQLQDTDAGWSNLGVIYYCLGEFDKSVAMHRRAISAAPRSHVAWANLGDALWFAGERDEAVDAYERADLLAAERLRINPIDVEALYTRAWTQAMTGSIPAASSTIARALQHAPDDAYANYYDALIKTRAGDLAAGMQAIQKAADAGYPLSMLAVEPHLEPLRADPEFVVLVTDSSRL